MSADLPKVRYLPGEQNQYVNYKVAHGSALSFEGWATEKRDGGGGGDAGAPYRENAPLCATALPAPPAPATLRPYQEALVDHLRIAYRAGNRAPLLQLATGGGKTVIFAEAARGAWSRGRRVLVLAHRVELVRQAAVKLRAAGVPAVPLIAGGIVPADAQVIVASVQTAAGRLEQLGRVDFIIADEAHHATAKTWRAVLEAFPDAKLLGVTATPARLDGKGLGVHAGGIFDALIEGPPVAELTALGFLSAARYFVPERRMDLTGIKKTGGDYSAGALKKAMADPENGRIVGDCIDAYRRHADHQPAIAFCVTVAHGEAVAEQFRAAGYKAACVHGGLPANERDAMIAGLNTGATEVLCSCELISEGLDVPAVSAVILLRPTASLGLHLQQVGRGLRPAPDKSYLTVLDHVGNCLEHGRADDPRTWTLDAGAVRTRAKGDAAVRRCEACGAANAPAARVCEACGAEFPAPEARDFTAAPGKLIELSRERIQFLATQPHYRLRDMMLSEPEIRAIARERGYRRGWATHFLREQAERYVAAAVRPNQ